jgi:aspartate kinase
MKVVKFGGSSLASGKQIEKVFKIVVSDSERKVVVVSAPGKRFSEDNKVTDLLIECGELCLQNKNPREKFDAVIDRYSTIAEELSLPLEIINEIHDDLTKRLSSDKTKPDRFLDY